MTVELERLDEGLQRTRGAVDGVDIAFRVRGRGPAVVLLHGTSANHAVWQPIAEQLAGEATVISLDQRGHGRSSKPASGYGGDDFADDVLTVLDALGIDRAIVAGHSMGARNAWVLASRAPERVSGVVAVDYTPWVETEVLDDLQVRVAGGDRVFRDPSEIEHYLQQRYPRMPHDAVARRAAWGYALGADGWHPLAAPDALRQLVDGLRTPWEDEFHAVTQPMTAIRGVDSRVVSPAAWLAAQAARPGDRWVDAEDADHYVPEELPALVAAEIGRMLRATASTD
ncbi:alpha/beta fold hydrolase [Schumannella soli]|uniref:Alpha/beta hydrolase n=1 Tax=Schumannella soli TaxID=2590779 RepID=A0A506XWY5_9MICO|nr:alpha/beta hydrolase [Schumannella soli]TPW77414.1 alpha/beta hydrolase [Schumannella soli]